MPTWTWVINKGFSRSFLKNANKLERVGYSKELSLQEFTINGELLGKLGGCIANY